MVFQKLFFRTGKENHCRRLESGTRVLHYPQWKWKRRKISISVHSRAFWKEQKTRSREGNLQKRSIFQRNGKPGRTF